MLIELKFFSHEQTVKLLSIDNHRINFKTLTREYCQANNLIDFDAIEKLLKDSG